MHWLIKLFLAIVIIAITVGTLSLWFNTFILGSYYTNAGSGLVILGFAFPFAVAVGVGYLLTKIFKA